MTGGNETAPGASLTVLRMRRALGTRPIPPVRWPDGVEPRCWRTADAAAVHALLVRAYADGAGDVPPFEAWLASLLGDAEFDAALCFGAWRRDGTLVGVALCWTSAFLKDLAVADEARGLGIGRALVATVLATFAARGAPAVELKVRPQRASAALALYERMGFVPADPAA